MLIENVNPFTISAIRWKGFKRLGPHPSWTKVMCKRNPIRGMLGAYSSALFDGCYLPCVYIYGSNGNVLKIITCRSNDRAKELCNEMTNQLEEFVKDAKNTGDA